MFDWCFSNRMEKSQGSTAGMACDELSTDASSQGVSDNCQDKLGRKINKLRLAKQAEVEVVEDCDHSESDKNHAGAIHRPTMEDEHSPNSDESDRTVVCTGLYKYLFYFRKAAISVCCFSHRISCF
jgi:hypothetical protein